MLALSAGNIDFTMSRQSKPSTFTEVIGNYDSSDDEGVSAAVTWAINRDCSQQGKASAPSAELTPRMLRVGKGTLTRVKDVMLERNGFPTPKLINIPINAFQISKSEITNEIFLDFIRQTESKKNINFPLSGKTKSNPIRISSLCQMSLWSMQFNIAIG